MYNIYVHSHERQMHNFVIEEPAGDSTVEMDQFGYFMPRKLWENIQTRTSLR